MLLVTGITGHTGRYFIQQLSINKYNNPIRCVVRETSDTTYLDSSGLNIEKVYGDLNDEGFIKSVVSGVNSIVHIYNIHHSPLIMDAAVENKVSRVILVHTTGIYSKFKTASQSYKDVERRVLNIIPKAIYPFNVTILRPTMIYGDLCDSNISKFINMIAKIRIMPVINGGKSLIQPVNARDLGKALYDVLMNSGSTFGKIYDLSGEKPVEMKMLFKLISSKLNRRTIFINVPLNFAVVIARFTKLFSFNRFDFVEQVQRMGENRSYSHDNASNDFGYSPMRLEHGIEIEVQQYINKNKKS